MKLSFSTVGCPEWMLNEVLAAASDFGYDGVEIRGLGEDIFLPKAPCFGPKRLATSLREIETAHVEISCLSSDASCLLASHSLDVPSNIKAYIDLAVMIGAKNIRILADEWGPPAPNVDRELVRENLRAVVPYAEEKGVLLLVETCGVYGDTKVLRELVESVDSPAVGVLWDMHHPYRYHAEQPEETLANVGPWIRHVHIKDSVVKPGGNVEYRMLGYGDIPLRDMIFQLADTGYDGHLSLEWMKRWNEELEAPGIVFSHYARKMRRWLAEL